MNSDNDAVRPGTVYIDQDSRRKGRRLLVVGWDSISRRVTVETLVDAGQPTRKTRVKLDRLLSRHYKMEKAPEQAPNA